MWNVLSGEDTDEREDQAASRRVCTRSVHCRTATAEGSSLSQLNIHVVFTFN